MSMLIFERVRKICNQKKMSISQLERKSGLSNGAIVSVCLAVVYYIVVIMIAMLAGGMS